MTEPDLPEHVRRNRAYWDEKAISYATAGHRHWAAAEPSWGIFGVPERDLRVLRTWPAATRSSSGAGPPTSRRGSHGWGRGRSESTPGAPDRDRPRPPARVRAGIPLIHGNAESVPLADASFDLAISEYGASIWADPYRWIPEASRLLRPGAELVFLVNGTLFMLCAPDEEDVPPGDRLHRPYFGMHRFEWPDDPSVEFHLGYGDWIRLLRANGFDIEDMIEVRPAADATTTWPAITLEWARNWPCEEIWKARKRG